MKYCPKCGVQCEDDQLFCAKCGSPLPVNVNIENTVAEEPKAEPEVVAEPVAEEAVAEEVVAEAEIAEEKEEPAAEEDDSAAEEPATVIDVEAHIEIDPVPEGKLNVGMLVWSIINLICCVVPAFGVISLIMTILAKNSAPETSKKQIKTATILNLIGSIGGVLFYIVYFIIAIITALAQLA